eukprot:5562974-Amphidinium_carterae.1
MRHMEQQDCLSVAMWALVVCFLLALLLCPGYPALVGACLFCAGVPSWALGLHCSARELARSGKPFSELP